MTDLTEKWKAGELESGYYYIVVKRVEFPNRIDFYNSSITAWSYHSNDCVEQVLAPVPSYEEYLESESHCAVYSEVNKGLKYSHNDDNRCSAAMPSSEEIEIIGNIHENADLLGEK